MGQRTALQKEIDRYREELLRMAARRPQEMAVKEPEEAQKPPEDLPEMAQGDCREQEEQLLQEEQAQEKLQPEAEAADMPPEIEILQPEEGGQCAAEAAEGLSEAAGREPAAGILREPQEQPENSDNPPEGPKGQLLVRVVTAHGLQPVKGALVTVSRVEQELQTLLQSLYTGEDGCAECMIPLSFAGKAGERPSACCHIRVDKPGFFTCHAYRVPVYEGEPAAQCARLLPLPGYGRGGQGFYP